MSTDQFSVDGDVAIVTGSSSGIGQVIAEQFADDGVDVVVCSREMENVEPVAEGINDSERPGTAHPVECDVTERDAVEAMVEATVEEFGGVDVLVNNAGASFMANFDDISPNGWKTIVDITSPARTTASRPPRSTSRNPRGRSSTSPASRASRARRG